MNRRFDIFLRGLVEAFVAQVKVCGLHSTWNRITTSGAQSCLVVVLVILERAKDAAGLWLHSLQQQIHFRVYDISLAIDYLDYCIHLCVEGDGEMHLFLRFLIASQRVEYGWQRLLQPLSAKVTNLKNAKVTRMCERQGL
ncbi:hypothetical protein RB195_019347 [Necator americanus]|uniref:Uncharacterized protein n=1 Tax=Necator americanus TaxID=51031 RepID=A0ABR1CFG9_NECAM